METKQKPNERRRTKPKQISYRAASRRKAKRGRPRKMALDEWARLWLTKADIEAWRKREQRIGLDDDLDGGVMQPIDGYRQGTTSGLGFGRQIYLAYCRGEEIVTHDSI